MECGDRTVFQWRVIPARRITGAPVPGIRQCLGCLVRRDERDVESDGLTGFLSLLAIRTGDREAALHDCRRAFGAGSLPEKNVPVKR